MKREILKKIAITPEDKETYNITEDKETQRIVWDSDKDMKVPFYADFTKEEINYLKEACEKFSDAAYPDDFWLTVEKIYNAANDEK